MYWLKNNYKKGNITEFSAEEKINSLREKIEGYIDLSFHTISAFGKNAAMNALFSILKKIQLK